MKFFKLSAVHAAGGKSIQPVASVGIEINGKYVAECGFGNGPIDAVFNAISNITGTKSELLRFSINALTSGTDAQGEVTVRLQEDGIIALGRGADPDIITASALAYINGLNRLEYLKEHPVIKAESI